MDLGTLREKINRLVGFKSGSPDQNFTGPSCYQDKWVDSAINEAVQDEYVKAVNECGIDIFSRRDSFVWIGRDHARQLPAGVTREQLIALADTTADVRGIEIWVGGRFSQADIVWRDYRTLEWGRSGPGSDRTITMDYIARPRILADEAHRPDILPEQFHSVLVWAAAIILREQADEAAPRTWERRLLSKRLDMWKFLEKDSPVISNRGAGVSYYERA